MQGRPRATPVGGGQASSDQMLRQNYYNFPQPFGDPAMAAMYRQQPCFMNPAQQMMVQAQQQQAQQLAHQVQVPASSVNHGSASAQMAMLGQVPPPMVRQTHTVTQGVTNPSPPTVLPPPHPPHSTTSQPQPLQSSLQQQQSQTQSKLQTADVSSLQKLFGTGSNGSENKSSVVRSVRSEGSNSVELIVNSELELLMFLRTAWQERRQDGSSESLSSDKFYTPLIQFVDGVIKLALETPEHMNLLYEGINHIAAGNCKCLPAADKTCELRSEIAKLKEAAEKTEKDHEKDMQKKKEDQEKEIQKRKEDYEKEVQKQKEEHEKVKKELQKQAARDKDDREKEKREREKERKERDKEREKEREKERRDRDRDRRDREKERRDWEKKEQAWEAERKQLQKEALPKRSKTGSKLKKTSVDPLVIDPKELSLPHHGEYSTRVDIRSEIPTEPHAVMTSNKHIEELVSKLMEESSEYNQNLPALGLIDHIIAEKASASAMATASTPQPRRNARKRKPTASPVAASLKNTGTCSPSSPVPTRGGEYVVLPWDSPDFTAPNTVQRVTHMVSWKHHPLPSVNKAAMSSSSIVMESDTSETPINDVDRFTYHRSKKHRRTTSPQSSSSAELSRGPSHLGAFSDDQILPRRRPDDKQRRKSLTITESPSPSTPTDQRQEKLAKVAKEELADTPLGASFRDVISSSLGTEVAKFLGDSTSLASQTSTTDRAPTNTQLDSGKPCWTETDIIELSD